MGAEQLVSADGRRAQFLRRATYVARSRSNVVAAGRVPSGHDQLRDRRGSKLRFKYGSPAPTCWSRHLCAGSGVLNSFIGRQRRGFAQRSRRSGRAAARRCPTGAACSWSPTPLAAAGTATNLWSAGSGATRGIYRRAWSGCSCRGDNLHKGGAEHHQIAGCATAICDMRVCSPGSCGARW